MKNWNVMKSIVKNFKKDSDVENYVLILMDLIENKGILFLVAFLNTLNYFR